MSSLLITGATGKIGKYILYHLYSNFNKIILIYNNKDNIKSILEDKDIDKNKIDIYKMDLTNNILENESEIEDIIKKYPDLKLLINSASIFLPSSVFDNPNIFTENYNIHFLAPLIFSQKFAKNIKHNKIKNANIINITDSSIENRYKTKYFHYLISKKSLIELTRISALEFDKLNIRVNAIGPSTIEYEDKQLNKIKFLQHIKDQNNKYYKIKDFLNIIDLILKSKSLNGQVIDMYRDENNYLT